MIIRPKETSESRVDFYFAAIELNPEFYNFIETLRLGFYLAQLSAVSNLENSTNANGRHREDWSKGIL